MKPVLSVRWVQAALLVVAVALSLTGQIQSQQEGQSCNAPMNGLSVCAPYVVPGVAADTTPSADCCAAFTAVPTDCLCGALRIASRLPTQCNLPPIACPVN